GGRTDSHRGQRGCRAAANCAETAAGMIPANTHIWIVAGLTDLRLLPRPVTGSPPNQHLRSAEGLPHRCFPHSTKCGTIAPHTWCLRSMSGNRELVLKKSPSWCLRERQQQGYKHT